MAAIGITWRGAAIWLLRIVAGIVAIPILYFLAALLLGLVPANNAWREAQSGITLFVRTNGVHTWILIPKTNRYMDWRPYVPGAHLREPAWGEGNYIAIGYGERDFYLNTPTWGDLSLATAFNAGFGFGDSLLHVEHDHNPVEDADTRRIVFRPEEYQRLVAFIRPRFRLDGEGRTQPLIGRGYRGNDMFYEAHGGYSFVMTCNEWTGRALRAAGIRTGLWTPLEQSIMWRLD